MGKSKALQKVLAGPGLDVDAPGVWLDVEVVTRLLLCSKQDFYNYARLNNVMRIKHPSDGRKSLYSLDETMEAWYKNAEGDQDWANPQLPEAPDQDLDRLKQKVLEYLRNPEVPSKYTKEQVEAAFLMSVSKEDDTMAENKGMQVLIVGDDVVHLRKDFQQIFGEHQDYPKPSNFEMLIDHVRDVCFGYLDESCDECMKHCKVQGLCAIERNKKFSVLAKRQNEEDSKSIRKAQLQNSMLDLEAHRKKIDGKVDEWFD